MKPSQFTDVPPGKIAAVVTSLEMHTRPPPRPEHGGDTLSLEHVVKPDLAWYRELFRKVADEAP